MSIQYNAQERERAGTFYKAGVSESRSVVRLSVTPWTQAGILEWVAYPFSSRPSRPSNQTGVSCITGGFFTSWTIREAHKAGAVGSIPGSGRSPGKGNGNLLQYSCLGNPMDKGAWQVYSPWGCRVRHDWATKPQVSPGRLNNKRATKMRSDLRAREFPQGCVAFPTLQYNELRPRVVPRCARRLTRWQSH